MPRREWKRENIWLRMLVSGPTGSGKSLGALAIASTIFDGVLPVCAIDTEHERLLLYADLVPLAAYSVIDDDYSPENYIREIDEVEAEFPGAVLIIDSVTHEWNNTGGILEIVDKGKGGNWKEGTPRHNKFVERILRCQMHVICCVRSKMQYEWTTRGEGGRERVDPRRIGVGPEQRDNFPYNFDIEAEIDVDTHEAKIVKARNLPALDQHLVNLVPDITNLKADNEVSNLITGWLSEGEPPSPPETAADDDVAELIGLLREEGHDDDTIDRRLAAARRQNRGALHPDYVATQLAKVKERLAKKRKADPDAKADDGPGPEDDGPGPEEPDAARDSEQEAIPL